MKGVFRQDVVAEEVSIRVIDRLKIMEWVTNRRSDCQRRSLFKEARKGKEIKNEKLMKRKPETACFSTIH